MTEEKKNIEEQEAEFDAAILCPGPDVKADPFHAIMEIDEEGNNTGQLWGAGQKLMLFESLNAAEKVKDALTGMEQKHFEIRGVSADHLEALKEITAGTTDLFVVVGFTPQGDVEAMPLDEHQTRKSKAGTPPPFPRKS